MHWWFESESVSGIAIGGLNRRRVWNPAKISLKNQNNLKNQNLLALSVVRALAPARSAASPSALWRAPACLPDVAYNYY